MRRLVPFAAMLAVVFFDSHGLLDSRHPSSAQHLLGVEAAEAGQAPPMDLHLQDGFNLFSFPFEVPAEASTCFDLLVVLGGPTNVESIARIDATRQASEQCSFDNEIASGTNFAIRAGEGYAIQMRTVQTLQVAGGYACPAVDLEPGVNLIGVPSPPSGFSCYKLLQSLPPADVGAIATAERFNPVTGAFDECTVDPQANAPAGIDFSIEPGEGYFVHSRDEVLGFNPNDLADVARCAGVCGDGVRNQLSEECDGADDSACPGQCLSSCTCCPTPTITSISPTEGTVGAEVTVTGTGLACGGLSGVQLECGGQPLAITALSDTAITAVIPAGTQNCRAAVTTSGGVATARADQSFTVNLTNDFSIAAVPVQLSVIQGAAARFTVNASGVSDFSALVTLSVSGLPPGVTASFASPAIAPGQSTTLTVFAGPSAPVNGSGGDLTISGTSRIDGNSITRTTTSQLSVTAGGRTGVIGQFVLRDGPPLQGVKLKLVDSTSQPVGQPTQTDSGGNFEFLDIPAGTFTMSVDATPADPRLPIYGVDVFAQSGVVNQLPPFMIPRPPAPERFTQIQNLSHEQMITDPDHPDAAYVLPAGATITGWDGAPKTKMTLTRLNPDQLPVPPPPGITRSVYQPSFGTPMGGLPSAPIGVMLPNDLDLKAGEQADLWVYDAAPFPGVPGAWKKAGTGTVSDDGKQVVSDPGVGITRFCGVCGLSCFVRNQDDQPKKNPDSPKGGEPIDFALGQMISDQTDLVLPGRVPIAIERTYNPYDPYNGIAGFEYSLGPGWALSVEVTLQIESPGLARLIFPGNARYPLNAVGDGTFKNSTSPLLAGAVLSSIPGGGHSLRWKDGRVWEFALYPGIAGFEVLVSQTDRNGNALTVERDSSHRITELLEPAGRALTFTYTNGRVSQISDPISRTVQYGYENGRLTTVTDPGGGVTRYTYDNAGRILSASDPRNITFVTNTYGPSLERPSDLRVIKQTLPDGAVWEFTELTRAAPCPGSTQSQCPQLSGIQVTDPLGQKTQIHFDSTSLTADEIIDPLGGVSKFQRDSAGRVTAITDTLGRVVSFEYDQIGNLLRTTDPAGQQIEFEYEPTFNQVTQMKDEVGNTLHFAYDDRGNLIAITNALGFQTQFSYDVFGQLAGVTDALNQKTKIGHDALGNIVSISDPLGNTTSREFDDISRLTSSTDPKGRTTRFSYTPLNQIREILDALGGRIQFSYDENGNVLSVTDPLNHAVSYEYDSLNRVVKRTDPRGATDGTKYDLAGNAVEHTDRKGQVSKFSYDPLGRLLNAEYVDSAVQYTYDGAGRLVEATDASGTILRSYDVLDRLVRETTSLGTISYEYDALGRRTSMTVPHEDPISYTWDAQSRLVRVDQGGRSTQFTYDQLDRRTQLALPNGVTTDYHYDVASRLAELVYRNAAGLIGNLSFSYDPAGRRTQVSGSLARAVLPSPIANSIYDVANRQLGFGDRANSFDANGNLTASAGPTGVTTFGWDARNRLVSQSAPGRTLSFSYDAIGRRTIRRDGNETTRFLYDALDVAQEVHGSQVVSNLRSLALDELLVRGDSEYPIVDALGSSVLLSNSLGKTTDQYAYDPFGNTSTIEGVSGNPFRYAGREDDGGGIYYYRARYYMASGARFLSEDPLEFYAGDVNLYAYVQNDPISNVDPLGLDPGSGGGCPKCDPNGYRDAGPNESANALDAAKTYQGVKYNDTPGKNQDRSGIDCSGLVACAVRDSVNPKFPTTAPGRTLGTQTLPNDPGFRLLGGGELPRPGDVILFPHHMGFYDPNNSSGPVYSATSHHDVTSAPWSWFGNPTGYYRVRVPCTP